MEFRKQQNKEYRADTGIERRFFNAEYRASPDGVKKIGGLAASYDSPTDMGWFVEVIKPGFFEGADTTETACLKNHDPNLILGRTANNTLILNYLPNGLDYEALPPDTICGNDTYTEVKGGYIYKSSFAFTTKEAVWKMVPADTFNGVLPADTISRLTYGGEIEVRELIKCRALYDVSPVTYPAYQATSSDTREDSGLREERNRFLPERDDFKEERAAVAEDFSDELQREIEGGPDDEESEETENEPVDYVIDQRQLQANQNRLRLAQARRAQFI